MGALFKLYKSDGITEITNIKSVVYREAVNTGEHLKPGCVCSAAIDVEIFNTQANAPNAGDVVYCYAVDKNNNQTLLGKFNCEPKIDTKNSYKITAHDNALKLNADFSQWLQANQSNFPMTIYALVSAACTVAGVTLGSASWPLSTENVQAFYADGITCRDILSYAAELAGRFVRCHTDGNVYFDWYELRGINKQASGAIASFDANVAAPMRSAVCDINPVQDLHGYGNPWPAGGGKNKFPTSYSSKSASVDYSDGKITLNPLSDPAQTIAFPFVGDGTTTYTWSFYAYSDMDKTGITCDGQPDSGASGLAVDRALTVSTTPTRYTFTGILPTTNAALRFFRTNGRPNAATTKVFIYDIQIEVGSSATTYAPYSNICPISGWTGLTLSHSGADTSNPTTYPVTWQSSAGTVYGGTLDVTTGVLTVTMVEVDLGTLVWNAGSSANCFYANVPQPNYMMSSDVRMICSLYNYVGTRGASPYYGNNGEITAFYNGVSNTREVYVHDNRYSTASDFTAAMPGVQLCYELATPQTYQLTPTEVDSLLGENRLWHDANGDTAVIYVEATKIAPSAGTNQYAYKQDGLEYANYQTAALARVAVHPSGENDVAYIYPTGVTSGNTLHVKNNLLLTGADASLYNAAAQQVFSAVSAVGQYSPMSVKLFPKESPFKAGDIVLVTDAQGVTIGAPVTSMTISNAASTLLSDGREVYEEETNTSSALTQLASDVVRINKLKVDWAEIDTAIVNYLSANNVTAQNLTIVDEYDNVLAAFNSNGINFYNNGNAVASYTGSAVTLGQSNEAHAEIDFNSFELKDKGGNTYALLGDMRGADGKATVKYNGVGNGVRTQFLLNFTIDSVDSVLVDGVATSDYTFSGDILTFTTAPSDGAIITVTYHTREPVYRYDIGKRKSGSPVGANSLAEGDNTEASGDRSHAEGNLTVASEVAAHAEGIGAKARGPASHAEGDSSTASGYASHAEGQRSTASGAWSHAEGFTTVASGHASHAEGNHTKASSNAQHVGGKFNIEDTNNTYAEIIGNGTDDNNRSNARTLDWNGNERLAGDVYVQGTNRLTPLHISVPSFSALPQTVSNALITSGMRVFNPVWGTPENAPNDCTYTTADGSITISGTVLGATTLDFDLIFVD